MRLNACLTALLSLFLLACGGGGGGASSGPVVQPAPSALKVAESSNTAITLSWTAPPGAFEGYELEARLGKESFQKIHDGLIPSSTTSLTVTFTGAPPEDAVFGFRLRTASGSTFSAYSNEATYTPPPAQPGMPVATFDWSVPAVQLSWARQTATSDGLRIERAECTQWGSLLGAWTPLPVPDPLASTYRDTGIASKTYYVYRITNLRGARESLTGQTCPPVFTGLGEAAWINAAYDSALGGMYVTWGAATNVRADGVRLERAEVADLSGMAGAWTEVPMPAGFATSFLDKSVAEGARYLYRVAYLYGSTATTPCAMSYPASTPLLAPAEVTAVATRDGIQLAWRNRSAAASQVVIRRGPSALNNDIALLSPGATAYLDPVASLGYYTYTVVAKNAATEAASPGVSAATLNPSTALALTATPMSLPAATDAHLRPNGLWAFATRTPLGALSNNDPWPATFPGDGRRGASPLIQVDASGWPHLVYATSTSSITACTLVHLWYDGAAWKSETMATATIPNTSANPGWTFCLDASGAPHVLLDHQTATSYGGSTDSLTYLHRVNGAWVEESLSSLSPAVANIGSYHITLDAAGAPHVLLGTWSSVIDVVRTGPGAWTGTTVPAGTVQAGWYDYLDATWVDPDNGWIFFERSVDSTFGTYGFWVVQKRAGAWLAPVLLGSRVHDGASTTARIALSPDRARVAAAYCTSAGIKAFHQTPDGWRETLVSPPGSGSPWLLRIGFDGSQKVHILYQNSSTSAGPTDFHE